MKWKVYLSGEIHTDWRKDLRLLAEKASLNIEFLEPETEHSLSDDMGVMILGKEEDQFWHDQKGAKLNSIRIRKNIKDADIVVVKFGEKYKQWNAAFDAGYAAAYGKSLIIMHEKENQHALKEIDSASTAVVQTTSQLIQILKYATKS
tara:strand:- start:1132 stop:1575 length:444 start_codon:yes stop_codon:yes gene_type:complete